MNKTSKPQTAGCYTETKDFNAIVNAEMRTKYLTQNFRPLDQVPEYGNTSTYNEMCRMETKERSNVIPGQTVLQYRVKENFGYSIPKPQDLPKQPLPDDHPLQNLDLGKEKNIESLPNQGIQLDVHIPQKEAEFQTLPFRGDEYQDLTIDEVETQDHNVFVCNTSRYLQQRGESCQVQIEKRRPLVPQVQGQGTGFNSDQPVTRVMPTAQKISSETTQKLHYPDPQTLKQVKGLDCLKYTQDLNQKRQQQ